MKKISLLFFLLSFSTFFSTFLYAWDWPKCRNTNGGDPEQPSTVYLGDKSLTFGHDSWATVNDKWPKWRMWISTDASLTSGTGSQSSDWSVYSNVEHKTSSSPQFTSTGTWYWGVQVEYTEAGGTTGWYCRNDKNWNNMWGTPTSTLTITVNPLNTPSSQTAAFTESAKVHLTWSKDAQGHNVMIVRYAKGASPTTPTNGTAYSVGSTLGSGGNQGTVVYNSSGTSYDDTGVTSGNNYDYYFYSENNSYYSSGMKATADYPTTPTTAASNLSFSSVKPSKMTLSWTSGNGANRIVVAKAGSAPTGTPSDGSSYTANAAYGTSGTALGDGYVVYNGSSNTVTVTALTASTTYYFAIYEYNGTGTATKYLTSSYLSGNQATAAPYQITVKFKMPTENWITANGVYLYAWNGGTLNPSGLGTWPGVAMESIGSNWYTKTFTFTNETVDIIFNDNNSGHQTVDITGVSASNCYEYDTWNGSQWTTKIAASCPGEYHYRSKGTGNWGATGSWEQSPDGIDNWTDATVIPSSGALGITIQANHTISVSSAVYSSNCTVNGTLEIQNGGSLSHAPTFGSGSTLKYNTGTSSVPGAEWKPNVTSGAGYPYNIQIASGTLQMSVASFANKYYAAGNVTIANGAKLDFNMAYDSNVAEHQGKAVVIVNGDITNNGTIYFANSTGGGNLAFQCKTMTNAGTLSLSENTSAPLQAIGGDMILTGDFINNGTFNCNGRAIVFTGSADQKIDGNTDGTYAIDFMVLDKTGGQEVTLYKDVTCKGYSANGGGYWALSLSGGTLVLNGKTLEISATDSDLATNKGRAGVQCVNGGKIKGDKDATVRLLGNYTRWTASSGQSLIFDQTKNGDTNVLKDLTINRIDSAGLSDKITINNIIIDHLLDIQAGKVEVSSSLSIDTAAVGRLSSTTTTTSLKVKNLILCKSPLHASEFYRNGRTLTIDNNIKVKVHFYAKQWYFISFPFNINSVLKADTTSNATYDTDYKIGIYDPIRRANRISGWKTLSSFTMKSDTGYIVTKKGNLEDLFFVTDAKGDHGAFNNPTSSSPRNIGLSYFQVDNGLECNFGWNFIAQPLAVKAASSLSSGEFAYAYNPAIDTYKLWYGTDNPGYSYGTSVSINPYESFFVKTVSSVSSFGCYVSSPQGVRRRADAQPEDVVQLNLAANGINYETLVRMKPESTAGYDELYDAPYSEPMNASTPRIYTLSNGTNYALALNTVPENTTVPVYVKVPQAGDYSFNWTAQLINLPVTLTDQQTGETIDLTSGTEYGFQTSTTEIKNRFYLNVPKRVITENVNIENTDHFLRIYPLGGNIEIEGLKGTSQIYLADMAGHILQAKVTGDSHCRLEVPVAGIYVLFIRDAQHSGFRTKIMVW